MGLKYVVDDEQFMVEVATTQPNGRTDTHRLGPFAKVSAAKGAATKHEDDMERTHQYFDSAIRTWVAPVLNHERRYYSTEINWKEIDV